MKCGRFDRILVSLSLLALVASACSSGTTSSPSSSSQQTAATAPASTETASSKPDVPSKPAMRRTIAPVEIDVGQNSGGTVAKSPAEQMESIRAALKPFQILLGRWKGLSQKTLADQPEWAYDWVTNPKQPGLRLRSEKGAYVRDGRLSYLPDTDQFEFASTDADGAKHTFRGTFTEPIRDVVGDEKKPQRTYKLQLTELEPNSDGEQWRITFNQQENNRYILEIDRKRGNAQFKRVDTIHTQREGTSFAISDTDYGDKTCIISQGLGTISVSYKGQSYWVCCSGCKAAFEEEPEKWIAKWEDKKKSAGK